MFNTLVFDSGDHNSHAKDNRLNKTEEMSTRLSYNWPK